MYLKKELYELIKTDESIFDFIQESALDGLWYWDLENPENEWMNPGFWKVLGYDPDEMPHKASAWHDIINQDDLKIAIDNSNKHCENPNHPYDQIVRYKHKNGSMVWIRCRGMAIRDKNGKAVRMLGAHHNVTELKKTEEQLQEVNKELESFSYSVAHDLRTPLRLLNGYAEILSQDYGTVLDEEAKRIIGNIKHNASKMGRLIDDLLSFSRLGRKEVQLHKINMSELTRDVLIEINKSVSHKAEINVNSLHEVMGDYSLLFQVMVNLLSNAIKYSSKNEKPIIQISSEVTNEEITFSVKDNGAGFDMKYASKLFGVFQRMHTEREFEGTGVGLAIVHRIITKHGGKIWAEGKVDNGATFYFTLLGN